MVHTTPKRTVPDFNTRTIWDLNRVVADQWRKERVRILQVRANGPKGGRCSVLSEKIGSFPNSSVASPKIREGPKLGGGQNA